ncbi:hypothetical protein ATK74_0815 [Propionicimonas paludicola]|uniref:Head-to-tail adaptor n=1 Tax=Propionicimonas paludicola TaxID=185243 RepID=A0A2A9CQ14_9ACTN|nr:hypothetical protein [Propionicimonas paludicola]PFG16281.1 hypothetical protein ATK74_0815 [Propionicimonas paludicola]
MTALIQVSDLTPFGLPDDTKTAAMITDALAQAVIVAPCLGGTDDLSPEVAAAAKAILRSAIVRWHDAGSGAITTESETAGAFSHSKTVDTSRKRKGSFYPSEITELQRLCRTSKARAFTISMSDSGTTHLPWCDVMFGGTSCSCGASLAGAPIYEL